MNYFQKKIYIKGFTLIELLIVIGIISILSSIVLVALNIPSIFLKTNQARADLELKQIHNAVFLYYIENKSWPADVSRGLPNGIETYLGPGSWPNAPFNDVSEYDWDNFTGSDGKRVLQISIRFCPLGEASKCEFPNADWAENFDYYSSYYLCIEGKCKSHPNKPDNHPGYRIN